MRVVSTLDMDQDHIFEEIYAQCKKYTMTSKERMYSLYKAIEYVSQAKIPGDVVECGVWRGGSAMLMALTLQHFKDTNRTIYLYDTYEGMSEPDKEDISIQTQKAAKDIWKKQQKEKYNEWCYASLEDVKKNMASTGYPSKNIVFVKGKVEDSIPMKSPKKLSLLRLDTDWYASTKHELIHMYPILSKRGVLIIDDYGGWEGARKAVDEYFSGRNKVFLARVDHSGRVVIKA